MTRGSKPRFNEQSPVAVALRDFLLARQWQLQDLAAALMAASEGRLQIAGAEAVARRAIHGANLSDENRDLLNRVTETELPFDQRGAATDLEGLGAISEIAARLEERAAEAAEREETLLRHLRELQATVAEQGAATKLALQALSEGIHRLEPQRAHEAREATGP